LNATLLAWPPGGGTPEHTNAERDVLLVFLDGAGTVVVDDVRHQVAALQAVLVPKGATRRITAGAEGLRYLSVHLRRPRLMP
jgi:quercetin dioxygenase-like cupin family protein